MSKRAWTEGPWEAVPELLYKGSHAAGRTPKVLCGEKTVASVHLPTGAYLKNGPCKEAEANARLIAAAPELYEALENARRSMIVSVTGISDGLTIHDIRSWIEQADGALAAANPKPGAAQ